MFFADKSIGLIENEGVVSVGAVNHNGEKTAVSAEGEGIDVVAPGESIGVEGVFGMHSWVDGTSMAAAHATGEASLLWQKDKSKSNRFIGGLMKDTAKDLGSESQYGKGILDVAYANDQYDQYAESYVEDTTDEVSVDQNKEQVETFTDEQVAVQGKWTSDSHIDSVTDVATGNGIEEKELIMIKRGSVYQDIDQKHFGKLASGDTSKWWHGSSKYNYFSAYRFATKMASLGGDTSRITSNDVPGLTTTMYNQMKSQISTSKIGGETWEVAVDSPYDLSSSITGIYQEPLYTGSDAKKTKLRKCFLYGMATHIATDTFAHSSYRSRDENDKIIHDKEDGGA